MSQNQILQKIYFTSDSVRPTAMTAEICNIQDMTKVFFLARYVKYDKAHTTAIVGKN